MDENELTRLLRNNSITSPYFCGVLSHDELNMLPTPDEGFYICNSDHSQGPGKHWLAIGWFQHGQSTEFFDSLAKEPSSYHANIENFLLCKGHSYKYSKKRIQSTVSIKCGEFCVFYAYHRCKGYSFEQILSMFSATNLVLNDIVVERFVNNM